MRYLLFCVVLFCSFPLVFGQRPTKMLPSADGMDITVNKGSKLFQTPSSGTLYPKEIREDWSISLQQNSIYYHNSPLSLTEYKRLKDEANAVKNNPSGPEKKETKTSLSVSAPFMLNNFRGNIRGGSIPMDNTMAVSRNGFVVSAINSNVIFAGPDGHITFTRGFADFYKLLGLGTRMFDPRVIYDPEQNRFIIVCLHGSDPTTTYLCIAFSKTEDPNGEWNFYKIKGNPLADDVWFDFPNIAVSEEDLYISGNMFTVDGDFRYSMIVQISKNDGYSGEDLTWKFYDKVATSSGQLVFNTVPAMSGWKTLTSPGMFFVSNGNGKYHLNYTDQSLSNDPILQTISIPGPQMPYPPEGRQKDVNIVLNTGGNRIRTAMYQNGILHFAAQSNSPNGDGGIFYGRINLADLKVTADILTVSGRDYAYPTLTSFGKYEEDNEVLVNYTYTGPEVYPGQAVRVVGGSNDQFDWSEEVVLKEGISTIGFDIEPSIRWGDYTGACRRFGINRIESWAVGCFGEFKSHGTWIGQIISNDDQALPVMEFIASATTTLRDSMITFKDITNVTPISRKWIFEGGIPPVSEEASPEIRYSENGVYNVTLVSTFENRTDTLTKPAYIHIQDPTLKPTVDWMLNNDTIFIGDSVQYINLSSKNSFTYKWTFVSGVPSTSTEKDPIVRYNKKGTFLVSLTAANIAGTTTRTNAKAITVLEKAKPKAGFIADKVTILPGENIQFSDASTGSYVNSYLWAFDGGIPETSTEKAPIVTYPTPGIFPVKLTVGNDFGIDSIIAENYINVGVSSNTEYESLTEFKAYPNPVPSNGEYVNVTFKNLKNGIYRIDLKDQHGRIVKNLFHDRIKTGENVLTFRTSLLPAGMYYISFGSSTKNIKTIPIIITD